MKTLNVYELPLAFNICDQMLRQVEEIPEWTMAHVLMNPKAWSLLHEHHFTEEAYVITQGSGELLMGKETTYSVQAGDVIWIPTNTPHKLVNTGAASLEHLVLATPPFSPQDVHLVDEKVWPLTESEAFIQPEVIECFDGAKIIAYDLGDIVSIAFGWVINDQNRRKRAHYHKKTTEWIFVVEGRGHLELDGESYAIKPGDWIMVKPGEFHALSNYQDQYMVVVCACNPCFRMDDVHWA